MLQLRHHLLWTFSSSKQRPGDVGISFKQKLLFIENSLCRCSHPSLNLKWLYKVIIGIFGGGILGGGDNFQTKQVNIIKCIETNSINLTNPRLGQGSFELIQST